MVAKVETCRCIVKATGVCGGKVRVENTRTRIRVHDVIRLLQNGETVDFVTRQLPGLTRAQVYEWLAAAEDHLAAVDYRVARQMTGAGKCLPTGSKRARRQRTGYSTDRP